MRAHKSIQRGVSLSGLLVWGVLIGIGALLGMKVVPEVLEFYKVKQAIASVSQDSSVASVADVQNAFNRYADINQISTINGKDLEVTRQGNRFVISIAYERRIPLFGPVSLVLDFQTSSGP